MDKWKIISRLYCKFSTDSNIQFHVVCWVCIEKKQGSFGVRVTGKLLLHWSRGSPVLFLEKNLKILCSGLCHQKKRGKEFQQMIEHGGGHKLKIAGLIWEQPPLNNRLSNSRKCFTRKGCQFLKIKSRSLDAGIAKNVLEYELWDIKKVWEN